MERQETKYIHRNIENVLKNSVQHFPAIAVTGPRQSGKSTLLRNTFGRNYSNVSFDDPLTRERAIVDPQLFIEKAGEWIIFDEIQNVPQILPYIKILIDKDRNKYGRFIITGSQQFHLIKDLGDTLAGRIALFDLLPFSVTEKRRIPFLKKKLLTTQDNFKHCCLSGSFPEVVTHPGINFNTWYGSYLQTYLERDIRTIYNIGSLREFQQFLNLLASRCAQILNLSSFAKDLGVSVNTIKKWLSILEASRIIYILSAYHGNLGKRITKNPKIYFLDTALVCYLTRIDTEEHLFNGPLAEVLFENFIIQETVKHFFNRGINPKLYYLRTHNNVEIDLIIEKSLQLYPFEIKLTKTPNLGMAGPIEKFMKIFSKLTINKGRIISLSEQDMPLTEQTSVIKLDSYLKELESLA